MHILPVPSCIDIKQGSFSIDFNTKIRVPINKTGFLIGKELQKFICNKLGITVELNNNEMKNQIVFDYIDDLDEEEYIIEISEQELYVRSTTDKGLFYGLQTLKQIIKNTGRKLPSLYISDKPQFANRGFYHDVTRGKVPTLESLKELVDIASSFKLNQLQLYIEHTFLFDGFSEVCSITDPLTAEEIIELDNYCSERFIELVPSIATFGHLYEVLRTETYGELCELEHSKNLEYKWTDRMAHHTLDVSNKDSIELVKNMIDQFIPLVKSNKFNICADETVDLGKGKNKKLSEKFGTSKLYVDFLNMIVEHVKKYNKEVMFWGDIIIQNPEYINDLPKDLICLNWWYWTNYKEEKVKMIKDCGFRQYICPGVHGWNKFMNNFQLSYNNIKTMTDYGKKYDAIGILNTDWGDYGHMNFFANSIPGIIYGAQFSWSAKNISFEDINKSIDVIFFDLKDTSLIQLLDKVSKMYHLDNLHLIKWIQDGDEKYIQSVIEDTDKILSDNIKLHNLSLELMDLLSEVQDKKREYIEAYYVSVKGIILFNNLIPYIKYWALKKKISRDGFMTPTECAIELEKWLISFKKIWLKRNKPSELYRIVDFIRDLCKRLRNTTFN